MAAFPLHLVFPDCELEITKEGKDKMQKYDGKLTEDQIRHLIKYMRTLGR
jgi:hypothetical protein